MAWSSLLLVAPLLLTVPIALLLIAYLYQKRGWHEFPLMLLITTATVWAACYGIELLLPTFEQKMKVVTLEYLGIALAPLGWLLLGLQLQNQLHRLRPWMIGALLVVPAATLVQVELREYHRFFWVSKELVPYGDLALISNTYGPGFWVNAVYGYVLQLAGGALILASIFQARDYYVGQRIALVLALVLPWGANAVYILKLTAVPIDFTPLAIVGSGILLIVGVFRYRLGDLIPVARDKLFTEMAEAVMVFDNLGRLIDINPAAQRLFDLDQDRIGQSATELLGGHPELIALCRTGDPSREILYAGLHNRLLRVISESLLQESPNPIRLLVFNDLSVGNRIETAMRLVVENTAATTGDDFFRALTRALAQSLNARYAMVGTLLDDHSIKSLAFWDGEKFRENMEYALAGTPCEEVLTTRTRVISSGAKDLFPNETIIELGAEAYVGTQLTNFENQVSGVLVVMHDAPLINEELCRSVLEIFAIRASAELERQRANKQLEDSEAKYRQMVETTRDGVCVVDTEGNIEFANGPMARMIGESEDVLPGTNLWSKFMLEDDDESSLKRLENGTIEVRLGRADGRQLWVALSKSLIKDQDGRITGMLTMFTDVTEPRTLAEQNKRIEMQLQHAQKLESLGVLAGGIAHDFNNLLMPILGYLDLIVNRASDDPVILEYVDQMRDAGGKLADLCNQMLTYSGKGQFIRKPSDLNDMLSRVTDLVRASTANNIDLRYDLMNGLPSINADETQLHQIIINLVINASEAMADKPSGVISITTGERQLDEIELGELHNGEALEPGRYVFVEVADEGRGIDPQDIARLFEPFFTTKFTGRGLGMAVVFGIVKGHQGAIEVESARDRGSRIRVYFPACEVAADKSAGHSPASRNLSGDGFILVVDDENAVREILTRMLESTGHRVVTASNGVDGLSLFRRYSDDLTGCIIDVTMPEMDGHALTRKILDERRDIPVVLVSGYQATMLHDKSIDDEHVTFLQKPFEIDELLDALIPVPS